MKKNRLLFVVVLLLAGITLFLFFKNRQGTISEALRDFGVKDTGAVVKIFLANKSGQQTLLEKQKSGEWIMNGKAMARPDAVETLLATMHDIEVRSTVGKSAYTTVIKT